MYNDILVSCIGKKNNIGLIQLNRPKALNALSFPLIKEVFLALKAFDEDAGVAAVILTGNERAFAAGADILALSEFDTVSFLKESPFLFWDQLGKFSKPLIAAVSGLALGGGMELAMQCDLLYCDESAQFGQPEINLGVIPGAGGTQRLAKLVGKHKAMELVLTGKIIKANVALEWGIVAQVFETGKLLEEVLKIAEIIGDKSLLAVSVAKKAIHSSFELPLEEGLQAERHYFEKLFSSYDQKEGMKAFMEKRPPLFKNC